MTEDNKSLYIKFFAPVVPQSIAVLMQSVDAAVQRGVTTITLLLSTPGGSVFHGLSTYNYLKGLPIEVNTHNFGSVDSIGVALFCAGKKRFSVPHARVLMHGVSAQIPGRVGLEEMQIHEMLKSIRIDQDNIARVVAATTGKTKDEVLEAMRERTTLSADEAISWKLATEIKEELFPKGAQVISIQDSPSAPQASASTRPDVPGIPEPEPVNSKAASSQESTVEEMRL
jgi:ATP-dependent protease ClpP protease subunit